MDNNNLLFDGLDKIALLIQEYDLYSKGLDDYLNTCIDNNMLPDLTDIQNHVAKEFIRRNQSWLISGNAKRK